MLNGSHQVVLQTVVHYNIRMDREKSKKPSSNERRAVTFSIRSEFIEQAQAFGLNASRSAEQGLEDRIHEAREATWLHDNAQAVSAHNKRVADNGMHITATWLRT